jgi:hypothetical protein
MRRVGRFLLHTLLFVALVAIFISPIKIFNAGGADRPLSSPVTALPSSTQPQ